MKKNVDVYAYDIIQQEKEKEEIKPVTFNRIYLQANLIDMEQFCQYCQLMTRLLKQE